ncbi:MAG: hypothetical protein ACRDAU_11680 [Clostridium sp.]
MDEYNVDLIDYQGVSDYIPEDINSRKEFNIQEVIEIGDKDIFLDEIIKVYVKGRCENIRRIATPQGTSIDGIKLTGRKAFVSSLFSLRVEYIASNFNNKIYSSKTSKNYFTSVILEEEEAMKRKNIATVFIEDIVARKISGKEVLIDIYGFIGIE